MKPAAMDRRERKEEEGEETEREVMLLQVECMHVSIASKHTTYTDRIVQTLL